MKKTYFLLLIFIFSIGCISSQPQIFVQEQENTPAGDPREGLTPVPPLEKGEVENATKELKELIQKFCGGNVIYTVLDESKNEVNL